MPRGYAMTLDRYDPIVEKMKQAGGENISAEQMTDFFGCSKNNLGARTSYAIASGIMHRTRDANRAFYHLGPAPGQEVIHPQMGEFMPSLWADGELRLQGLPDACEDGSIILNTVQRRRLAQLLTGQL